MPCYDLLLNATQAPFLNPQCTTPALHDADPGLVPGAQSFVDWVEQHQQTLIFPIEIDLDQ